MSEALKVLIIAGGLTHEREVSERSGRRVANALSQTGHVVRVVDLDSHVLSVIDEFDPDVIWPLVHGSVGEDGSLQTLLDATGVPYVGTGAAQAHIASHKPTAKALVASSGWATPGWMSLPQLFFRQVGASQVLTALSRFTFPSVVKPADGGSALGISIAHEVDDLRGAMVDAFAYGERVMVEEFIEGRDVAVSVVDLGDGPAALPPVEISTDSGHYDYNARYTTDATQYFVPARFDEDLLADIQFAALDIHRILGLRDLSRIDFVVDEQGTAWFIDANVVPGMTDTSLFPQAADASGSFIDLCAEVVAFVASGRPEFEGDEDMDEDKLLNLLHEVVAGSLSEDETESNPVSEP